MLPVFCQGYGARIPGMRDFQHAAHPYPIFSFTWIDALHMPVPKRGLQHAKRACMYHDQVAGLAAPDYGWPCHAPNSMWEFARRHARQGKSLICRQIRHSMSGIGAGPAIYDLQKRIQRIQSEIDLIGNFEPSPELIELANLLRSNEYLQKKTEKQSELIRAYDEYSLALLKMLHAVFDIQVGLKDVLKQQSLLLSGTSPKRRKRPASTSVKRGQRRRT